MNQIRILSPTIRELDDQTIELEFNCQNDDPEKQNFPLPFEAVVASDIQNWTLDGVIGVIGKVQKIQLTKAALRKDLKLFVEISETHERVELALGDLLKDYLPKKMADYERAAEIAGELAETIDENTRLRKKFEMEMEIETEVYHSGRLETEIANLTEQLAVERSARIKLQGLLEKDHQAYDIEDGDFEFEKFTGRGKRINDDGTIEEGEFVNGELVKGKKTNIDRTCSEGDFKKGILHGEGKRDVDKGIFEEGKFRFGVLWGKGKRYDSNRLIEKGEYVSGVLHGHGIVYKENGSFDEGIFHNGKLNQYTRRYNADTKTTDEGTFENGLLHGRGRRCFPDGIWIVGEFELGQLVGEARKHNIDGSFDEGKIDPTTNRLIGEGFRIFNDGSMLHGFFKDGSPDTANQMKSYNAMRFTDKGIFNEEGQLHGSGKRLFHDGTTFEGNFTNGSLGEEAQKSSPDGLVFNGKFNRYGYLDGKGSVTFPDGTVLWGEFQHDELQMLNSKRHKDGVLEEGEFDETHNLHGNGTRTLTDGTVLKGKFQHGELQLLISKQRDGFLEEGIFDENHNLHGNGSITALYEITDPYKKGFFKGIFEHGKLVKLTERLNRAVIPSEEVKPEKVHEEGEFDEGFRLHGIGKRYIGLKNTKNGYVIAFLESRLAENGAEIGTFHHGEFQRGHKEYGQFDEELQLHGEGCVFIPNKGLFKGVFDHGKLVKLIERPNLSIPMHTQGQKQETPIFKAQPGYIQPNQANTGGYGNPNILPAAQKVHEEGEFDEEYRLHGKGKRYNPDGSVSEEGEFVHGVIHHGKGKKYMKSGICLECAFEDGKIIKIHRRINHIDGSVDSGDFSEAYELHGHGCRQRGDNSFSGEFVNGEIINGKWTMADGSYVLVQNSIITERHYLDGSYEKGEFNGDYELHGSGIHVDPNGKKTCGVFDYGKCTKKVSFWRFKLKLFSEEYR